MDKASDFESEDCAFESRRGRFFTFFQYIYIVVFFFKFCFSICEIRSV